MSVQSDSGHAIPLAYPGMMITQVPLALAFNPELDFAQFYPGRNAEALEHVRRTAGGAGERLVFLWGPAGTGKTHLLNACCKAANTLGRSAAYLPLPTLAGFGPAVLEGVAERALVCLDDIDWAAGRDPWEHALFDLFNRCLDTGTRLLVAGTAPPSGLPFRLADLQTRLGWGLTLRLQVLDDDDKLQALQRHALAQGFELPTRVGRLLLQRNRRDLPSLLSALDELARASLAAQRRLSVPFVKSLLEK